jgi:site-specific DNA recombinase
MYGLAREHLWPNPHPPLGYDKQKNGALVPNKKEISIIRQIFKTYASEKSIPQVAFKLNAKHIPTKKSGRWNSRAVRDILINAIYVGKYHVAGVEEQVEEYRAISDETFRNVQLTLHRYKTGVSSRPPMQEGRRSAKLNGLLNKYREFLNGDLPTLSKGQ